MAMPVPDEVRKAMRATIASAGGPATREGWAKLWQTGLTLWDLGAPTQNTSGPPDRYGGNVQAGIEFATVKGVTAYIAVDGAVMTDKQRFGGQVGVFVPF